MAKFKIGDKVRFLGTSRYDFGRQIGCAVKGKVYTISAVHCYGGDQLYNVEGASDEGSANWYNMEKNFELVGKSFDGVLN